MLLLSLISPKDDILISLSTATIRSASLRIIVCRLPKVEEPGSEESTLSESRRLRVENSNKFDLFWFEGENMGWSCKSLDQSSASAICRGRRSRSWLHWVTATLLFPRCTDAFNLLARSNIVTLTSNHKSWPPLEQATIYQPAHIRQMVVFSRYIQPPLLLCSAF